MVGYTTAEKDRAKIERLYNRLKRMGYLPADALSIPALVDQAEESLFRSIHQESSTCSPPSTTSNSTTCVRPTPYSSWVIYFTSVTVERQTLFLTGFVFYEG